MTVFQKCNSEITFSKFVRVHKTWTYSLFIKKLLMDIFQKTKLIKVRTASIIKACI